MRNYRIFISHSWNYNEYDRIVRFLDEAEDFSYSNYSVSMDKAVIGLSDRKLSDKLRSHIKLSQIILVPVGMEVNYRRYIKIELEVAQAMGKPIVRIIPRGMKRIPRMVEDIAWKTVKWNGNSIVKAIEAHAL